MRYTQTCNRGGGVWAQPTGKNGEAYHNFLTLAFIYKQVS